GRRLARIDLGVETRGAPGDEDLVVLQRDLADVAGLVHAGALGRQHRFGDLLVAHLGRQTRAQFVVEVAVGMVLGERHPRVVERVADVAVDLGHVLLGHQLALGIALRPLQARVARIQLADARVVEAGDQGAVGCRFIAALGQIVLARGLVAQAPADFVVPQVHAVFARIVGMLGADLVVVAVAARDPLLVHRQLGHPAAGVGVAERVEGVVVALPGEAAVGAALQGLAAELLVVAVGVLLDAALDVAQGI
ncbi:hypothetical protein CATMIT_01555, partial [Catenibacterium mitsuokai DSM 15897]